MAKVILVLCVLVTVVWTAEIRVRRQSLTSTSVNVDEVLKNDRLLNHYYKCLLIEGQKCTPEGAQLKKALPDTLKNGCPKCNEKDRADTEKVIRHLIDRKPDMWKKLEEKYDPTGEYRAKYRADAARHGIEV